MKGLCLFLFTWTHLVNGSIVSPDLAVGTVEHLALEAGLVVDTERVEDALGAGLLLVQAHTADPLATVGQGSHALDVVGADEGGGEVPPPVH